MEKIRHFIKQQLKAWEVPGCAVVAVREGKAVLNEGFGLRDVGAKQPVTAKTLFAIGSVTKSFTSAAIGSLVDDRLVEWDKPLRDYLPDFKLHDPVATERVTPRDLLCHRTGLPRHDFVWDGFPERSRLDLVRRLRHLPLSRDIRQAFQYCNLGFAVAGHLVEAVTGRTWEDYVAGRLFKPLKMDRSNFSIHDSQRSDDFAKAYQRRQGKVREIPMRDIDAVGPAGSINSCTDDMLQWLLVNLNGGRRGRKQVISRETIKRMQSIQMGFDENRMFPEATGFGYGLGWSIGQYRGRRLVSHAGGIDGFLTECMLLPQNGIGVVVLTNSSSGIMGPVIAYRLLDELLELEPIDWFNRYQDLYKTSVAGSNEAKAVRPRVKGAGLPRPVAEYAGEYEHPGYGTLSIRKQNGKLVPGFGALDLALSHRHFDVFDLEWREAENVQLFPLTFLTAPEGDVAALTVPFESLVEPIRFERRPDPRACDPRFLQGLTGSYTMGPIEILVELRGKRTLTLSRAGGLESELIPGRGLRFKVTGQPNASVEFVLKADGTVEKILFQPVGIFTPGS